MREGILLITTKIPGREHQEFLVVKYWKVVALLNLTCFLLGTLISTIFLVRSSCR